MTDKAKDSVALRPMAISEEHRTLIENAIMALDEGVAPGSEHANDLRVVLSDLTNCNAPLSKEQRAKSISEEMMNLADRLSHGNPGVDPRAWERVLLYAPSAVSNVSVAWEGGPVKKERSSSRHVMLTFVSPGDVDAYLAAPAAPSGNSV
jgi:hypothetical protein